MISTWLTWLLLWYTHTFTIKVYSQFKNIMSFFKYKINFLFLCIGFLIDFTDIPEQLWLKVFPLNQITLVNVLLKSPWFLLNFPFAYVHTKLLPRVSEMMQIYILCVVGAILCLITTRLFDANADKYTILFMLTLVECVPAFSFTVLSGYMASNISKYNGDIARDTVKVVMIGQYIGRCVSGVLYEESNITIVFSFFGLFTLLYGHMLLAFHLCGRNTYVNLVDEELGPKEELEPKEDVDMVETPKSYRSHINTLLLFTIQPSAATAVFYLMTGPFHVLPSSMTAIKTALSFVRVLASFTGSLTHLSANSLSFVLHWPIVAAHVGYIIFVSQNYTISIDDEVIYFLIGCVSTIGYTIFTLSWNDIISMTAASEKGRESIVMAKWTTIFFFVSMIPNIFEYASLTVLEIDHGKFDLIPQFAVGCLAFTCVTWALHRLLSLCCNI